MSSQLFDSLSAFYAELWQHLDVFFDDHRWFRMHIVLSIEERDEAIKEMYDALVRELKDSIVAEQVTKDMEAVDALVEEYVSGMLLEEKPEPDGQWFRKADRMREYLQTVRRRYGELALDSVRS